MNLMSDLTLAQITEFIAAAQEANAVNVLAVLLEYKNAYFADFGPMDEFTLECLKTIFEGGEELADGFMESRNAGFRRILWNPGRAYRSSRTGDRKD